MVHVLVSEKFQNFLNYRLHNGSMASELRIGEQGFIFISVGKSRVKSLDYVICTKREGKDLPASALNRIFSLRYLLSNLVRLTYHSCSR